MLVPQATVWEFLLALYLTDTPSGGLETISSAKDQTRVSYRAIITVLFQKFFSEIFFRKKLVLNSKFKISENFQKS